MLHPLRLSLAAGAAQPASSTAPLAPVGELAPMPKDTQLPRAGVQTGVHPWDTGVNPV